MKKIVIPIFLMILILSSYLVFSDTSPIISQTVFDSYGFTPDSLSHREKNIQCEGSLQLSINTQKPMGLYYSVSNEKHTILYRDNFEFNSQEKNKYWALIQFPQKGIYSITVLLLDQSYKTFLHYTVNCSQGFNDSDLPVYTTKVFQDLGFKTEVLPYKNLVVETDRKVTFPFKNEQFLKYGVSVTDLSLKPEFLNYSPNPNYTFRERYQGISDYSLYAFFSKKGLYIFRFYAWDIIAKKGGCIAEYIIKVTGDNVLSDIDREVYGENTVIPEDSWYAAEKNYDYSKIDDYVKKTPLEIRTDIRQLAAYLQKIATNDREKARTIYVWLQYFIRYDEEMRDTMDLTGEDWIFRTSFEGTLELRYAVCNGYATLFVLLARLMNMEAVFIEGIKIFAGQPHAWNAILVDNHWRLLDATSSPEAHITIEQLFLTDPKIFMFENYPSEPFWQLQKTPHTMMEVIELFMKKVNTE
ncbi:MAG: hypothetical protein JXJ04_14545 [Spirochaetales bacterium]|nr:hypothetical protein [Spirochaetales bacterium]